MSHDIVERKHQKASSAALRFVVESHPWHHRRHHTENGFRNIWAETLPPFSFLAVLRWMLGHLFQRKENVSPSVLPVDPALLRQAPDRLRIIWLGHSSLLIQTPDLTILTDPVFSDRASPFSWVGPKRLTKLPLALEDLPRVDIVLLSHNHYDHCDKKTIRFLCKRFDPVVLAPLGVERLVRQWGGKRVAELDWWQYVDVQGIRFHAAPAKHFSGRGLTDRDRTLWASWYLEGLAGEELRIYFGGDTAYADHFSEIRERFGAPEVAMIPVGAYLPRWFMGSVHVDPAESVQAFRDLEAEHFIPIHWGVFDLADEPLGEPIELTQKLCREGEIDNKLHVLSVGEILAL